MGVKESDVTAKLRKAIAGAGAFSSKIHQSQFSAGFPDMIVFGAHKLDRGEQYPTVVCIEVKVHPNTPSKLQLTTLGKIAAQNALAEVWTWYPNAVNLKDAKAKPGAFKIQRMLLSGTLEELTGAAVYRNVKDSPLGIVWGSKVRSIQW